jgi:hypothetical protein
MTTSVHKSLLRATILAGLLLLANRASAAPGDLYVAEAAGGGHIYRYTPAGDKSTFASGLYQPVAIAFDRAGNLFVGNSGACGCIPENPCECPPATVVKILPNGTQTTFATLQTNELLGMAFDGAGNLFVSTGQSIVKIAPNGTQSTFASGLQGAWALAFDNLGNLYAGVHPIEHPAIWKFAADGSSIVFATLPGSSSVVAVAFGPGGNLFAQSGDSLFKFAPDASRTTFATGEYAENSLAFDTNSVLFAGENAFNSDDPAIVKLKAGGPVVLFAHGPLLPSGFAFEPVTEKIRNVSARGLVAGGDNTLIGGFTIGGSALANNAIVVRALGPSLSEIGVSNPLPDPVLQIRDGSGALVASNNDWQDSHKAQISGTGLAPLNPKESAIFLTLPAGQYTAVVLSGDQRSGTAVVEAYSVSQ